MGTIKVIQIGLDEALKIHAQGDQAEYEKFTEKFKPKKTTDDCYTPDNVYEAVLGWVRKEYDLGDAEIIRPFYPGEDYQERAYPVGSVVVDNPPFSILSQIVAWYDERQIPFFLFGPALTIFSARRCDVTYIPCGVDITYENGAVVPTSFITNLDTCRVRTAPDLYRAVRDQDRANLKMMHKEVPKYYYPDHIITAAIVQRWCQYGIEYRLNKSDCVRVSALDAQKEVGQSIFGGGYLLADAAAAERAAAERAAAERAAAERAAAERAAAERAAAERAAATRWALSDRERRIVQDLGAKR